MKQYDVEENLVSCILQRNELINELYVDTEVFSNSTNKQMINFFKKFYQEFKTLDLVLMVNKLKEDYAKEKLMNYCIDLINLTPAPSLFYEYQEQLISIYKDRKVKEQIQLFEKGKLNTDELVEKINLIENEVLIIKQKNKVTPEEMIEIVRNKEKIIDFPRFKVLNEKLKIKKKTVNVIGARPSEGKSALALNLFCDLAKNYKCLYFNMEMTEAEVYERMLGIESNIPNRISRWKN